MSKLLLGVALLALVGCGGSEQGAVFDEPRDLAQAGALATAGSGASGGSEQAAGGVGVALAGQQSAGAGLGGEVAGTAGSVTSGGSGGSASGSAATGGFGGGGSAGAAGQIAIGGGGSGGVATGGAAGNASSAGAAAGSGGYPPIECLVGSLDCDGIASNGCETSKQSHDHCGACNIKCGITQKCLPGGEVGSGYCGTP